MSQENVEIIRAQYEAWNAGDMAAIAADYAPDAIVDMPPEWPDAVGPLIGLPAITEQFAQLREVWRDADSVAAGDFVDHGDHVLVRTIWRGQGSGPAVAMAYTNIYTLRHGKIVRLEIVRDHAKALEAVGLEE